MDDREVEDDWVGTYSDNGDYVEAQPSKGEQASSRKSNQSINRQENDEVSLNPRKVDKHHIDIYPVGVYTVMVCRWTDHILARNPLLEVEADLS